MDCEPTSVGSYTSVYRPLWGVSAKHLGLATNRGRRRLRLVSQSTKRWLDPDAAGGRALGRSSSTLALGVVYWTSCLVWVPLEELALHDRFGEQYDYYRKRVPRWFGFPRDRLRGRSGGAV